MPFIDALLQERAGPRTTWMPWRCPVGPGSFTGLRIGVSTAKGLCHALNIPLIALDTLALLAEQGKRLDPTPQPRVAMIDARRMEVYAGTFDADGNLHCRPPRPVEVDKTPDAFKALPSSSATAP